MKSRQEIRIEGIQSFDHIFTSVSLQLDSYKLKPEGLVLLSLFIANNKSLAQEIDEELWKKAMEIHSAHLSNEYAAKHNEAFGKFNTEKKKLEEKLKDNKAELGKQLKILKERTFMKGVDIELLIDHIDHAVKVADIDHVGFGSDFISGIGGPIGLETAAGYPLITYHLLKRGYEGKEIKKILGGNLLRIFSEAQKISSELR